MDKNNYKIDQNSNKIKEYYTQNYCEEDCCICLDNLDYEVCLLSCNHLFHFDCLSIWILKCRNNNKPITCPLCKQEFDIHQVFNLKTEFKSKYKKFQKQVSQNNNKKKLSKCCIL